MNPLPAAVRGGLCFPVLPQLELHHLVPSRHGAGEVQGFPREVGGPVGVRRQRRGPGSHVWKLCGGGREGKPRTWWLRDLSVWVAHSHLSVSGLHKAPSAADLSESGAPSTAPRAQLRFSFIGRSHWLTPHVIQAGPPSPTSTGGRYHRPGEAKAPQTARCGPAHALPQGPFMVLYSSPWPQTRPGLRATGAGLL